MVNRSRSEVSKCRGVLGVLYVVQLFRVETNSSYKA